MDSKAAADAVEGWLDLLDEWGRYVVDSAGYMAELKRLALDNPYARTPDLMGLIALVLRGQSTLYEAPAGLPLYKYGSDVLVGFRNASHTAIAVTVTVNSSTLVVTTVPARSCQLAWYDNGIPARTPHFPGAALDHQASPDLYYVFAHLTLEARNGLCWGCWQIGPLRIRDGFISKDVAGPYLSLPSWGTARLMRSARKRQQQDVYLQELLATACHPRRLPQIVYADELEALHTWLSK